MGGGFVWAIIPSGNQTWNFLSFLDDRSVKQHDKWWLNQPINWGKSPWVRCQAMELSFYFNLVSGGGMLKGIRYTSRNAPPTSISLFKLSFYHVVGKLSVAPELPILIGNTDTNSSSAPYYQLDIFRPSRRTSFGSANHSAKPGRLQFSGWTTP